MIMKSLQCTDIILYSVLFITIAAHSNAELEQTKNRRAGGASGLYAFPRVGRGDPSLTNAGLHNPDAEDAAAAAAAASAFDVLYPGSFEEYEEYPKSDVKRKANLYPVPRVGRMDPEMRKLALLMALQRALTKKAEPSATSGVWFGPRLGKRSVDNQKIDNTRGQKEEY
ncbi:cardio acceleratory peptide 2b [Stomoxys calcitrans]|uniref:cardio acceleratory peptide 2b n=1 Tax=Stomoxys calcitrans TaxID=35570 RepID=UPI0027E33D77|nr:cardio acceleratory peptide 2b [Stomoxys calcitrans]